MKVCGQLMEGHILLPIFIWGPMGKFSVVTSFKSPRKADMTISVSQGIDF